MKKDGLEKEHIKVFNIERKLYNMPDGMAVKSVKVFEGRMYVHLIPQEEIRRLPTKTIEIIKPESI